MAYSLNPSNDNCYEGTTCLINKLNIHDEAILANIEAEITYAKTAMLEENPIYGNFNFEHYKKIHYFLFSDIYEWAGTIRTVNISKKRTNFLSSSSIESIAEKSFDKITNGLLDNLSFDNFVKQIA